MLRAIQILLLLRLRTMVAIVHVSAALMTASVHLLTTRVHSRMLRLVSSGRRIQDILSWVVRLVLCLLTASASSLLRTWQITTGHISTAHTTDRCSSVGEMTAVWMRSSVASATDFIFLTSIIQQLLQVRIST